MISNDTGECPSAKNISPPVEEKNEYSSVSSGTRSSPKATPPRVLPIGPAEGPFFTQAGAPSFSSTSFEHVLNPPEWITDPVGSDTSTPISGAGKPPYSVPEI